METEGRHILMDIIGDEAVTEDSTSQQLIEMGKYRVLSAIFKQGREWHPGEDIVLPIITGSRLVSAGEVEFMEEAAPLNVGESENV